MEIIILEGKTTLIRSIITWKEELHPSVLLMPFESPDPPPPSSWHSFILPFIYCTERRQNAWVGPWTQCQVVGVQIQAHLLSSCVAGGKLLNLSVPQFPHL